jgi:hypothetical protein
MTTSDTNVAQLLRDIAAESDAVSGMIIKLAQKAAAKGQSHIVIKYKQIDTEHNLSVERGLKLTPPMERLETLGFTLGIKWVYRWGEYDPDLVVKW